MKKKALAVLVALVLLAGCEDRRSPRQVGIDWFPSERAMAACIIDHESGGDPYAVSPTNDHGLFQINKVHARDFYRLTGRSFFPNIYNPALNGQYAKHLRDTQGWTPWSTYRICR